MGTDVFISYPSARNEIATAMCAALEKNGITCWIAPRDILPGITYADALIQAIDSSKVMVLVYSSETNKSPHILREVERAVHNNIPIIPVRVDNSDPSNAMQYYISTPHWLDAFVPPFEQHLDRLVKAIKQHLENLSGKTAQTSVTNQPIPHISGKEHIKSPSHVLTSKNNMYKIIPIAIAIIVIIGVITVVIFPNLHPSSLSVPNGTVEIAQPMLQSANTTASGGSVSSSRSSNSSNVNTNSLASSSTMTSSDSTSLTGGQPARVTYVGISPIGTGNVCGTTAIKLISKGNQMCLIGTMESVSEQNVIIKVMIYNAEDCSSNGINPLAHDQFTITATGTSGQSFSHVLNIDTTTLPYSKLLCLKAGILGYKGVGSLTMFQIS
jgi:hypothetical protein